MIKDSKDYVRIAGRVVAIQPDCYTVLIATTTNPYAAVPVYVPFYDVILIKKGMTICTECHFDAVNRAGSIIKHRLVADILRILDSAKCVSNTWQINSFRIIGRLNKTMQCATKGYRLIQVTTNDCIVQFYTTQDIARMLNNQLEHIIELEGYITPKTNSRRIAEKREQMGVPIVEAIKTLDDN